MLRAVACALICAVAVPAAVAAFAPPGVSAPSRAEDAYLGLPDDRGREEVFAYCGACHSMKLVVQQGQTRQGWSELLAWMYKEQGMPKLEPDEEKLVLDYLAKHVGPDSHRKRLRQRGVLP